MRYLSLIPLLLWPALALAAQISGANPAWAYGFLLTGVLLMGVEAFVGGFGILGTLGIISLVVGIVLYFDHLLPQEQDAQALLTAVAMVGLLFTLITLKALLNFRHQKAHTGAEQLIGTTADVIAANGSQLTVRCHGEHWQAHCSTPLQPGQSVTVIARQGLTLIVQPKQGAC